MPHHVVCDHTANPDNSCVGMSPPSLGLVALRNLCGMSPPSLGWVTLRNMCFRNLGDVVCTVVDEPHNAAGILRFNVATTESVN